MCVCDDDDGTGFRLRLLLLFSLLCRLFRAGPLELDITAGYGLVEREREKKHYKPGPFFFLLLLFFFKGRFLPFRGLVCFVSFWRVILCMRGGTASQKCF